MLRARFLTLFGIAVAVLTGAIASFAEAGQKNSYLGGDGVVTTDMFHSISNMEAMAIQPDGKILAGGDAGSNYVLARFNPDGTPDTSFADGGKGLYDFGGSVNEYLRDLLVLDNGKILGAGRTTTGLAVLRWNANGTIDTTFGQDGIAIFDDNGQAIDGYALALQSTGKIVAVGRPNPGTIGGGFAMARFNADGAPDASFAGGGGFTDGSQEGPRDVVVDDQDRIITVGGTHSFEATGDVVVQRFTPDGAPDNTFGGGDGIVKQDFGGGFDRALSVALQDGKILIGGQTRGATIDWLVARFNPDGTLDGSFTTLIRDFSGAQDAAGDVGVIDGMIAVGGTAANSFGVGLLSADGAPQSSFGGDGFVQTFVAGAGFQVVTDVLAFDGQSLLIGGGDGFMSLLAYDLAGNPDTSFGDGGAVFFRMPGGAERAVALVRQPNGKLIAAGYSANESALARYNADGTLDQSFGDGGRLVVNIVEGSLERIRDVALQPDGKIVVTVGISLASALYVARFNPDGSLDAQFGDAGLASVPAGSDTQVNAVAVDDNGRIILTGSIDSQFMVAALLPGGSLDASFGSGGFFIDDFFGSNSYSSGDDVIVRDDGRIAAAGVAEDRPDFHMAIVSITPSGDADNSFSADGVQTVEYPFDSEARGIAELPDGRIALAGTLDEGNEGIGVALLDLDGNLDTSFSADGKTQFKANGEDTSASAVAVQPDGKIVVTGGDHSPTGSNVVVARVTTAGELDGTFGGGLVAFDIAGDTDQGNDVIILPDTSIVVAGVAGMPMTRDDFLLLGLQGDLPPQPPGIAWADWNCDGFIDSSDVLYTLSAAAGIAVNTPDGCPGLGDSIPGSLTWGNFGCTGTIGQEDWLGLLAYIAGIAPSQPGICPDPGEIVETDF